MQTKIRLGIVFGGQSAEHEVSIRSAKSIIEHLDQNRYEICPIGIDKKGTWHFLTKEPFLISIKENRLPTLRKNDPFFPTHFSPVPAKDIFFSPSILNKYFDIIFPILHGPLGEDGTIQGLFELANIPYVGPDHLSSAICMDKGIMKDLLTYAGLPTPKYLVVQNQEAIDEKKIIKEFALPLFVKPAQLGSSVGVSKVHTEDEFLPALQKAFRYDERLLIEEYIEGREVECSVLGNRDPMVSLPGEIIPTHEFYSYEAKYLDENGAYFELPAKLAPQLTAEVQRLALAAFKILRCEGMARVDFFLSKRGKLYINELNTIPGFTAISLYPKLWEISGIPYRELIERLLNFAIERHNRKKAFRNCN